MIEQMSDYIKGRTTVTSRFEEVESLEPPTITVCMFPPFKTSMMNLHHLTHQSDVLFTNFSNQTLEDRFESFSYLLERDYMIELSKDEWSMNMSVDLATDTFDVKPIQTLNYGTCYKIQPKVIFYPKDASPLRLHFSFNSNLKTEDKPSKIIIYLTSNNTWQGITTSDWPQFTPLKIMLDIGDPYFIQLKPREYLFHKGVENSAECWKNHILKSNCEAKCKFASFTDLPMCKSPQEFVCIYTDREMGDPWNNCFRKKKAFTYHGELTKEAKYSSYNDTFIEIYTLSFTKEVREEIDVISLSDLIGSLGGSLGMFFGFSISAYALYLIDKLIARFLTRQ